MRLCEEKVKSGGSQVEFRKNRGESATSHDQYGDRRYGKWREVKAQNETTTQIAAPHPSPLPRERGWPVPIPSHSYSPAPQSQRTINGAYLPPSPLAGEGLGMRGEVTISHIM